MEMLLYQSTQFRDVKKILDRAHGFAGLLTAGGIEASRLDIDAARATYALKAFTERVLPSHPDAEFA